MILMPSPDDVPDYFYSEKLKEKVDFASVMLNQLNRILEEGSRMSEHFIPAIIMFEAALSPYAAWNKKHLKEVTILEEDFLKRKKEVMKGYTQAINERMEKEFDSLRFLYWSERLRLHLILARAIGLLSLRKEYAKA